MENKTTTPNTTPTPHKEKIYQVALLQSLTLGQYDGFIKVKQLKKKGDTGIGTFDKMDGELIMLDGIVYQVLSDGSVVEAVDDTKVPFGDVTFFSEDFSAEVQARLTFRITGSSHGNHQLLWHQRVLHGQTHREIQCCCGAQRTPTAQTVPAAGRGHEQTDGF